MFGVYRYVHTLRKAIDNKEKEIKWCAHTGETSNNDNSVLVVKEMFDSAGYKFVGQKFSLLRCARVLTYKK